MAILGLAGCFSLAGCGDNPQIFVERSPILRKGGAVASYAPVISNVAPTVVSIYTRQTASEQKGSSLLQERQARQMFRMENGALRAPVLRQGLGSGVVVSEDGYIVTNSHVVEGADEIIISTASGQEYTAKLIGIDQPTDLAVLKADAGGLKSATLAESRDVRVGDVVLAIGNPFGVGQTVTSGIVSAVERAGFGITEYEDFIQTDASINPGNSGGALVDAYGRIIGINTAILSQSGGSVGIGFAVPADLARGVIEQIIKNGKVQRGYLGVYLQPVSSQIARKVGIDAKGAFVSGIAAKSPAFHAGLLPGDIITMINEQELFTPREARLTLGRQAPGVSVQIRYLRGGKQKNVTVRLAETPPD